MKKYILVLMLVSSSAIAENIVAMDASIVPVPHSQSIGLAAPSQSGVFWSKLRHRIEGLMPKRGDNIIATNAVAGVRGAAVLDEDFYWAGEKINRFATDEELGVFSRAIRLADDNKLKDARDAFSGFLEKYPDSPLCEDAKKALDELGKELPRALPNHASEKAKLSEIAGAQTTSDTVKNGGVTIAVAIPKQ